MKIFIACSKHHYHKVNEVKEKLEHSGHIITIPYSFDDPMAELRLLETDKKAHIEWVAKAWDDSEERIKENDAMLILNINKNGKENYIGGATFTEMFMAYRMKKKIFLFNDIPECILSDEIKGMNPTIINGNLDLIN